MTAPEQAPLELSFGARVGRFVQQQLEKRRREIPCGEALERFEGDAHVSKVITKGGLELPAAMAVVGVGVIPDVTLAQKAGLEIGERGGVRCSSRLETSVRVHLRRRRPSANTSRSSTAAPTCGSSTGMSRSTKARPRR